MSGGAEKAAEPEAPSGARVGDGAPQKSASAWGDLSQRVVSGVVLGAAAAFAVSQGGYWTMGLAAVAALVMGWEFRRILAARHGGWRAVDWYFPLLAALTPVAAHLSRDLAYVALGVAAACAAIIVIDRSLGAKWRWSVPGFAFIASAAAAFVFLRDHEQFGGLTAVWLVVVVVATDVGAYFAGRMIGGPKLAPRLSPKKTWAGLGGGAALAALCGTLFSGATTGTLYHEVAQVSVVAALVAQAGDLGESAFKRRFGVKDASGIIPGHGGALDRLDGLMAATIIVAVLTYARGKEVYVW